MNRARARLAGASNRGYISRPLSSISGTITRPAVGTSVGGKDPKN